MSFFSYQLCNDEQVMLSQCRLIPIGFSMFEMLITTLDLSHVSTFLDLATVNYRTIR
jgi:hypothetical protein